MPRGKAVSIELSKGEPEALERNVRRHKSAFAVAAVAHRIVGV
jgi:hypothetical protein